jgi:hypothetical protein
MQESVDKSGLLITSSAKIFTKNIKKKEEDVFNINQFCDEISEKLDDGKRIRRKILDEGRLFIDRPVPFLVLYRKPIDRPDIGTNTLANTEAAYLISAEAFVIQMLIASEKINLIFLRAAWVKSTGKLIPDLYRDYKENQLINLVFFLLLRYGHGILNNQSLQSQPMI